MSDITFSGRCSELYQRWILRRPRRSLLLCLALVAGLASQLGNLQLDASSDSLVLEGDDALSYYREISRRYASEDFLVVTFQPTTDLLGAESLATVAALRDEFRQLPGVSSVVTILDVPLLQSPPVSLTDVTSGRGLPTLADAGIDRELVRREFASSPIYRELLVSPDGRTTAIQINLQRDERYFGLLQRRESLRALAEQRRLTGEERAELRLTEREFKDYTGEFNTRRSALVAQLRQIVDNYRDRGRLFLGGVPMIAADMLSFVKSDLLTFGSGILVFVVLVLTVIFRQPRWVGIPLLTCVLTATAMLGLLAVLDWRMTVISSNFVALLLIVTLAITIHLAVRYRELHRRRPQDSQYQLVAATVQLMAIPCCYTTPTTAVAFLSLLVSGIRPVIDFGAMMTLGLGMALLLGFVVLPCLLVLLPRGKALPPQSQRRSLTLYFARATEARGGLILVVACLLALVSGYGISRLQVENRFIDYFHDSTEIYQGMELLDSQLGGTISLDIIIDAEPPTVTPMAVAAPPAAEDYSDAGFEDDLARDAFEAGFADDGFEDDFADGFFDDDPDAADSFQPSAWFTVRGMGQLESIHNYLDSLPETGKVLSLATTYAVVKQLLGSDVGDVELALVQKSLPPEIGEMMIAPYFDEAEDEARLSMRIKETSRELRRDEFLRRVYAHIVEEFGIAEERLHFTNMLVLYNNVLQSLFTSQILTLGAVFLVIMLMFLVLFRSLLLALLAIAPNLLAAGIVLGGMGWFGIPLDIMTITIAAIVVGIGVDHAIHYVHRFQREFPADRNYTATMFRCHESIGKAMYYTSVTVIAGFSILALSNFTPSIYFGLLTGLAMLASVIGSLLLLPQLIITFKPLGAGTEA